MTVAGSNESGAHHSNPRPRHRPGISPRGAAVRLTFNGKRDRNRNVIYQVLGSGHSRVAICDVRQARIRGIVQTGHHMKHVTSRDRRTDSATSAAAPVDSQSTRRVAHSSRTRRNRPAKMDRGSDHTHKHECGERTKTDHCGTIVCADPRNDVCGPML